MRTTTDGEYSNHSVGYAIDVNYHDEHQAESSLPGGRPRCSSRTWSSRWSSTDPSFAACSTSCSDTGLGQLQAAHAFNQRFRPISATLLDLGADQGRARSVPESPSRAASYYTDYFRALREQRARALFDRVDGRHAAQGHQEADRRHQKKAQLAAHPGQLDRAPGLAVRCDRARRAGAAQTSASSA